MSLRPQPVGPVPSETARVVGAAFPYGHPYLRLADELGILILRVRSGQRIRPALAEWLREQQRVHLEQSAVSHAVPVR